MCTKFVLKHITCKHDFWMKRICHRHPRCELETHIQRERGGECWDCDPEQGPPEALFHRRTHWRRVPRRPCGGAVSVWPRFWLILARMNKIPIIVIRRFHIRHGWYYRVRSPYSNVLASCRCALSQCHLVYQLRTKRPMEKVNPFQKQKVTDATISMSGSWQIWLTVIHCIFGVPA